MSYVRPSVFDSSWTLLGGVTLESDWAPPYGVWIGVAVWDERVGVAGPRFWTSTYKRGDGYEKVSLNGPQTGPDYSAAWMLGRTNDELAYSLGIGANAFYDPGAAIIDTFESPNVLVLPVGVQEVFEYTPGGGSVDPPPHVVACDPMARPPFPYGGGLYLNPTPPADVRYHRLPVN